MGDAPPLPIPTTVPRTLGAGAAWIEAASAEAAMNAVTAARTTLAGYPEGGSAKRPGPAKTPAPVARVKSILGYAPKKVFTRVSRSALFAAVPNSSIGKARKTTLYVPEYDSASVFDASSVKAG